MIFVITNLYKYTITECVFFCMLVVIPGDEILEMLQRGDGLTYCRCNSFVYEELGCFDTCVAPRTRKICRQPPSC